MSRESRALTLSDEQIKELCNRYWYPGGTGSFKDMPTMLREVYGMGQASRSENAPASSRSSRCDGVIETCQVSSCRTLRLCLVHAPQDAVDSAIKRLGDKDSQFPETLHGVLTELLRLYDWRNEIGRIERDFNHDRKQVKTWLNRYGREKKAAWEAAVRVLKAPVSSNTPIATLQAALNVIVDYQRMLSDESFWTAESEANRVAHGLRELIAKHPDAPLPEYATTTNAAETGTPPNGGAVAAALAAPPVSAAPRLRVFEAAIASFPQGHDEYGVYAKWYDGLLAMLHTLDIALPDTPVSASEAIGEVAGYNASGNPVVKWYDDGLRPIGLKLYRAPVSSTTPTADETDAARWRFIAKHLEINHYNAMPDTYCEIDWHKGGLPDAPPSASLEEAIDRLLASSAIPPITP